jgi:AraC-like DNA-binding protein
MSEKTDSQLELALDELKGLIAQLTQQKEKIGITNESDTAIDGLRIFRYTSPTEPHSTFYEPCICLVAQGAKHVALAEDEFTYDRSKYLITSVYIPGIVNVVQATPEEPYFGLVLMLDSKEMAQMMLNSKLPAPNRQKAGLGMATGEVTLPLVDAFNRLVRLLLNPQDIAILAPIFKQEILYRLFTGERGEQLRQIVTLGSQSQQIAQAIDWMKGHFEQPIRVEELATKAHMGSSTFHHHFRNMTAMTPLQYQKNLRLQEARRLMLMERLDATTASQQVGYESSSQFSREYSRMFGAPPLKDVAHLRQLSAS